MKNILFICTLSLISRGLCYCQEANKEMRHDTLVSQTERKSLPNSISPLKNKLYTPENDLQIYQCVLRKYRSDSLSSLVSDSTYLGTIKRIDFKKQDMKHWWFGDEEVPNWRSFFDSIDTSALKKSKIYAKKIAGYQVMNRDSIRKKVLIMRGKYYLSPVIYSADKILAICAVQYFGGPLNASEEVFLLQFKDKKWKVLKYLLVSVS